MAQRILALELAQDRVEAALAERAWSSFALLGTYQSERAEDEPNLAPAIGRLLSKTGAPDLVISAMPGELVAKRLLTLPFSDRRKLEQAVPFALEEHLPFSIEEAVVAYLPLLRDGKNSLVLAALARREDLRAHLDLLAEAGLDPKTVTLSSLALSALINRARNGNGAASHLLVEFEHGRTSVVLLDNGVPRALRTLPVGLDPAHDDAQHAENSAGAIIAAVRQTMLSHSAEPGSTDIIISGPAASSSEVRDRFSRELAAPIHGVEDLDTSALLGRGGHEWIRQASCVAMLLGEMPNQPVPLLNLRVGEFNFQGRTGDLTPFYTSGLIAIGLAVLIVLHVILGIVTNVHHKRMLNREIAAAVAPVIPGVAGEQAEHVLAARLAAARKRLGLLGGSGGPASPLDTLLLLSRALPAGIGVDIDELNLDDTGLKIAGKADSYATIEQLRKALSATHRLSDVQVSEEGQAENHKVVFHLSAGIKDISTE
ncbi:MAG TPA: type II secretion system protein GspL [Candidatus Binataceae bacterium]|nr:type II secretion system protein GspL [Candidatus Binataceae bacterium]